MTGLVERDVQYMSRGRQALRTCSESWRGHPGSEIVHPSGGLTVHEAEARVPAR